MNFELIAKLAALFGAMFIIYHIVEMFRGVKMGGIGPIANPFSRKKVYRPLLASNDWLHEQGRIKISRRNPDAVDGVSVSYYSGRRDVVTWDWDNIIQIEEVKE